MIELCNVVSIMKFFSFIYFVEILRGFPSNLRQGRQNLMSNKECLRNALMDDSLYNETYIWGQLRTNKYICAGSTPTSYGVNVCRVRFLRTLKEFDLILFPVICFYCFSFLGRQWRSSSL